MELFVAKNILISACLLGKECRYNGRHSKLQNLSNSNVEWISVCPEELGEFGVPRPPAEKQKNGRILTKSGNDVTEKFNNGAREALKIAVDNKCEMAILKSKSPSCGKGEIYDGTFSNILVNDDGVFTKLCTKNGIEVISSNEINKIEEIINPL